MSVPGSSLQGKVAIVTGSRRGIGEGTALIFAEAGADVVVSDAVVEGGELEAVADKIKKLGRRCLALQADVSLKADVDNVVRKTLDEFGAIDILVNNAGTGVGKPLMEVNEEEWDRVIDVNLKGCYLFCQAVGRGMIDRKRGNIINIASVEGFKAVRPVANPYASSKAGIMLLTRGLAWELGPHNIRVNAIAPGGVRTEMLRPLWSNPEALKLFETRTALGRMAEPADIASVALFLASDASSYITGQTIIVDGGFLA